jgi:Transposase, Mutator family
VAEAALQMLMEADVEGLLGAARHERSPDRPNYRNGCRDRSFDTRPVDGGNLAVRVTEATVQNRCSGVHLDCVLFIGSSPSSPTVRVRSVRNCAGRLNVALFERCPELAEG